MNGVKLNFFELLIPIVCDKIIFKITDFIKVDLPAAFGPVIKILFLIFTLFLTVFETTSLSK